MDSRWGTQERGPCQMSFIVRKRSGANYGDYLHLRHTSEIRENRDGGVLHESIVILFLSFGVLSKEQRFRLTE